MSGDIIQLNPEAFQSELKGLVKKMIILLLFCFHFMRKPEGKTVDG